MSRPDRPRLVGLLMASPRVRALRCVECGNRGFVVLDRAGTAIDACPDCTGRAEALWRRHRIIPNHARARHRGGAALRQVHA